MGSGQRARPTSLQQLLYTAQWQAAGAHGDGCAPARQPLLAAVLQSGQTVGISCSAQTATARLLQALQSGWGTGPAAARQWLLASSSAATPSITPASAQQGPHSVAAASLHGMLKVAASERMIAASSAVVYYSSGAAEVTDGGGHFGAAVSAAVMHAPVLLAARPDEGSMRALTSSSDSAGAALLTGGLGGLGLLTAAWQQQQHGHRHLVLFGRSGRSGSAAAAGPASAVLTAGSTGGCQVTMLRSDVAAAEEAAAAAAAASRHQHLRSVLHAGGVLADALLSNQTAGSLRAVAAPKLCGMRHLAAAAAQQPLQHMLAYSSIAGELGTAGQGNYAAANAGLDATAAVLQQQGRVCSSVQWGAWVGAGMAASDRSLLQKLQRQGYSAVQPAAGLGALSQLLLRAGLSGAAAVMAAPFDWARFLSVPARRGLPYFAAVAPAAGASASAEAAAPGMAAPIQPLAAPVEPATTVTAADVLPVVQRLLADLAGEGAELAPPDVPFLEAGLDSIGAVELRWGGGSNIVSCMWRAACL